MAGRSSDIEAGAAFVRLYSKDDLSSGLDKAAKNLHSFGMAAGAVGAGLTVASASVAAFGLAAVNQFSTVGDAVDKMAARTGLATEAVSELGHAAGLSGTDIGTLENGIKKMQDTLAQAAQGSEQAIRAFDQIGVSAERLAGMAPDAQFAAIADGIAAIEDPSMRTAAAMDIFGKAGTQLIPLMAGGAAGIAEMRQQARELGLSLDRETVTAAAQVNDALGTLQSTISGLVTQIGAALAPTVTAMANRIFPLVGIVSNWIRENRGLVVGFAGVVAAVGVVGVALTGLGATAIAVSAAMTGIGAVASAVFSPIGLTVAVATMAIAAAVIQVYRLTDGFRGLLGPLSEAYRLLQGLGTVMSQGGLSALGATLRKAGAVLWSFLMDVLDQLPGLAGYALGRMARVWFDRLTQMYRGLTTVVSKIGDGLKAAFSGDFASASQILREGLKDIQELGSGFVAGLQKQGPSFKVSTETARAYKAVLDDIARAERSAAVEANRRAQPRVAIGGLPTGIGSAAASPTFAATPYVGAQARPPAPQPGIGSAPASPTFAATPYITQPQIVRVPQPVVSTAAATSSVASKSRELDEIKRMFMLHLEMQRRLPTEIGKVFPRFA